MELNTYVARLHSELLGAAAAGDDRTREIADRLAVALDPVVRLTLLDALTEAAEEITRELAPGSVELRLRGRAAEFAVSPAPADSPVSPPAPTPPPRNDADEATARLTVRLPEPLKLQVESVAAAEGLSVNAWLVRTVAAALQPGEHAAGTDWSTGRQQLRGWVR